MAKKKPSQPENQEQPNDQSETIANLKSLNKMLVKETVERREEVSSLLKSKQELEAAIERLERQGSDRSIEDEIQRRVTTDYVSQQKEALEVLVQQKSRDIEKLNGEFESFRDETGRDFDLKRREIDEHNGEFRRFRDEVGRELDLKRQEIEKQNGEIRRFKDQSRRDLDLKNDEVERLSAKVSELEKSNAEVRDENDSIRRARDEAWEEKSQLEKKIEDLERVMAGVLKDKEESEKEKAERDVEVTKLQRQLGVLEVELERERSDLQGVVSERDEVQKSLNAGVKETEQLRLQVVELEKCNTATEEELGKVRLERRRLVEERKEREKKLEALVKENGLIEANLAESVKSVEDLKSSVENIVREKEEVESERAKLVAGMADLQTEVDELRRTVLGLQKKENDLVRQVSELEKHKSSALEKQEEMQLELRKLATEKNEVEEKYEFLLEGSRFTSQNLEQTFDELEAEKEKFAGILLQMDHIEEVKNGQKIEIENLQEQVAGLRKMVSALENSLGEQVETLKQTKSEAIQYKSAHESVTLERDNVKKEVNLKEKEGERLRTVVRDLEKGIEATKHDLEQIRNKLSKETKVMKNCINTLTEEKGELQRKLEKADDDIKALLSKMNLSRNQNEQMLLMVKNTVELMSHLDESNEKEASPIGADDMNEDIKPLVIELESIRQVFKNEKGKAEELNKQIESLKSQMEQIQKKNGLARLFPYALAVAGAVASMAYCARNRTIRRRTSNYFGFRPSFYLPR